MLRGAMVERGFYTVSNLFFNVFPDPYLKNSKGERRPFYFAIQDNKTGLYWLVPMSSRTEKYKKILIKKTAGGKSYDGLHICMLDNGVENVFLLQDMFPIERSYIKGKYTVNGNHLKLTSDAEAKEVLSKAKRVLAMLHRGYSFTPTSPDVIRIEEALLKQRKLHPNNGLVTKT
jgi:hypothetical protein